MNYYRFLTKSFFILTLTFRVFSAEKELTLDDVFPADRVVQIDIELSETDWDTIRDQTRTIMDALPEERKFAPPESPYTYVFGNITIDGVRFPDVGIRKKGFVGSQSRSRPSLKIDLNRTHKDAEIDGHSNLTLNNNNQDNSLVSQFLGYKVFQKAGLPAPRAALAKVSVNGKNLGIYTHVESIKKTYLKRAFGTSKGTLFEGTVVDFFPEWESSFEFKSGKEERGRKKIVEMIEVLNNDPTEEAIGKLVDLDAFYKFWAIESLLGFWDGYSGNSNNFFIYLHPDTDKFHFSPWGADSLFVRRSMLGNDIGSPLSVKTRGLIANVLYKSESARARYLKTLNHLLEDVWNENELLEELEQIKDRVKPHVHREQKRYAEAMKKSVDFIETRRSELKEETLAGMPEFEGAPSIPIVIPKSFGKKKPKDQDIWTASKEGNLDGIKTMIKKGVDHHLPDEMGMTPLNWASMAGKLEVVQFLISKGADVNVRTGDGGTPLHSAAFLAHKDVVSELIEQGAKLNAMNLRRETPLDAVSGEWNVELEQILGFISNFMKIEIDYGVIEAARPQVAKLLREKGAKLGRELKGVEGPNYIAAAMKGDADLIKNYIKESTANINEYNQQGLTPLSLAAFAGHADALQALVDGGAEVDKPNLDRGTPIHGAVFLGQLKVVEVMIKNNVDINALNQFRQTPLDSVSGPWNDKIEGMIKLVAGFLQVKVDVDAVKENRPKIAAAIREAGGKHAAELK